MPRTYPPPTKRPRRTGMVLVLVLVVIAILTLSSLRFSELMLLERRGAQMRGQRLQARAAAESGVEMARQFLDRSRTDQYQAGGSYDNPDLFGNVLVADSDVPQRRSRFVLVAPRMGTRTIVGLRCGLEDESTRINLSTILQADQTTSSPTGQAGNATPKTTSSSGSSTAHTILMALPSMTDQIADAILDWIDSNSDTRQNGAEMDYYSTLTPGYAPRNGPPTSIEELLLVRGVTPQLLFGLDAAKMAPGAPFSTDGTMQDIDNSDGSMDHGWAAYLTLHSAESNLRDDGTAKINLNGTDLKKLYEDLKKVLKADEAKFIVACRQNKLDPNGSGGPIPAGELKFSDKDTNNSGNPINSVVDLIDAKTTMAVEGGQNNQPQPVSSIFKNEKSAMSDYLPKLLDNTTTNDKPGRININQASRVVLLSIPNMTADLADQIIARRTADPATADSSRRHATWLLTEGLVKLDDMKKLMPYVNGGGCVYRVHSVGLFDQGGTTVHLEVLLNAGTSPTRVVSWRDISHLGTSSRPNFDAVETNQ